MVDRKAIATRARLFGALAVAGVVAVLLMAAAFWLRDWQHGGGHQRFTDPRWWAQVAGHLFGYLAIGKVGFKVALVVIAAVSGLIVWARRRPPSSSRSGTEVDNP